MVYISVNKTYDQIKNLKKMKAMTEMYKQN